MFQDASMDATMPNGIGSRMKTGSCQTGQLPGRIKSELCDLSGLRIDLISRLLSLSRVYSGILHSRSLSRSLSRSPPVSLPTTVTVMICTCRHACTRLQRISICKDTVGYTNTPGEPVST